MPERAPGSAARPTWRFGAFELDPDGPALREDGAPVALGSKALRLLVVLAEARGDFVPKETLVETVWPGVAVSDASLYTALREARRAVGDDGRSQRVIETRKGRGYRFAAPLRARHAPLRGRHELREALEAALGVPAPDPLVDRALERTGGDPAAVEALAAHLADEELTGLEAALHVARVGLPRAAAAPSAAEDEPPGELREALEAAATLGRVFAPALLPHLGVAATRARRDVDEALRQGWLEPDPREPSMLRFRQARVRERLLHVLDPARRAALEGLAARALVGGDLEPTPETAGRIAFHLLRAGEQPEEAIAWCRRAARGHGARGEHDEAMLHHRAALSVAGAASYPVRLALWMDLGETAFRAGDHEAGRAAFLEAVALARAQGDGPGLAAAALGHAGEAANTETGRYAERRVRLLEEALAHAPALGPATVARLQARLALDLRWSERADEIPARLAQAIRRAREAEDPEALASVLHDGYWATWSPDNLEERLALSREMAEAAGRTRHDVLRLLAGGLHGASLLEAGDRTAAEQAFLRGEETALPESHAGQPWWALTLRAGLALLDGRFEEAESLAVRAHGEGRRLRAHNADTIFRAQMGWLRFDQERLHELADLVPLPPATRLPLVRASAALVLACAGRTTEARQALAEQVLELDSMARDAFWLGTLATLVEAAARLGAREEAAVLARELAPYRDRCVVVGVRTVCRGSVAFYLGLAARLEGRTHEAVALFEHAVRAHARLRAAPLLARAQLELARARRRRRADGDAERARTERAEALALRARLGLAPADDHAGPSPGT